MGSKLLEVSVCSAYQSDCSPKQPIGLPYTQNVSHIDVEIYTQLIDDLPMRIDDRSSNTHARKHVWWCSKGRGEGAGVTVCKKIRTGSKIGSSLYTS